MIEDDQPKTRRKPPAFQFYANDWTSSHTVASMSMHHRGIYITLLAAAWESEEPGTLPLPLEIAARSARLDIRSLRDFLAKFPRCFVEIDGKLVNEKLHKNWLNYQEISEKRRKAAGARHHANAEQVQCPSSLSSSSSSNTNNTPLNYPPKKPDFELPDWIPQENWQAFIEMRQRIRKPLTPRAKKLAINELIELRAEGNDPAKVLDQSVLRSWTGLFPLRSNGNGSSNTYHQPTLDERVDEAIRRRRSGEANSQAGKGVQNF